MRQFRLAPLIALVLLAGCGGSNRIEPPIGISKSFNGLRQSVCNCGGLVTEEEQEVITETRSVLPSPASTNSTNTPPVVQTVSEPGE